MSIAVLCLTLICVVQGGIAVAMLLLHRAALRDWAEERASLLQRIQAPEHAVVAHYNEQQTFDSPPAVNPELDEDHWTSKEDLAELAAHEELSNGR